MKSVILSLVLIALLSIGSSLFAQVRGPSGGPPIQSQGGQAGGDHGFGRPSDAGSHEKGPNADHNANATARTGQQITDHPALAAKLQSLLPPGTDLSAAAMGFKNMGQFVAAVHVSHNLDIPFDQLKMKMVTDHMSLGQAIHTLKPAVTTTQATTEVKKAESQAKKDQTTKS